MSSVFEKAKYTEEECEEHGCITEGQMFFGGKTDYYCDIAFMERQLAHYQYHVKHLKEVITKKKDIVKAKLQKLEEDKTLTKEEKKIQKRKILNNVF
jgi:hypothetical protein